MREITSMLFLLLVGLVLSKPTPTSTSSFRFGNHCTLDLRLLELLFNDFPRPEAATDCASYMASTVTPATVTVLYTVTTTASTTNTLHTTAHSVTDLTATQTLHTTITTTLDTLTTQTVHATLLSVTDVTATSTYYAVETMSFSTSTTLTLTSTTTSTSTSTSYTYGYELQKRGISTTLAKSIPTYSKQCATACYTSACSCIGVTAQTTTLAGPTTTKLVYVTVTNTQTTTTTDTTVTSPTTDSTQSVTLTDQTATLTTTTATITTTTTDSTTLTTTTGATSFTTITTSTLSSTATGTITTRAVATTIVIAPTPTVVPYSCFLVQASNGSLTGAYLYMSPLVVDLGPIGELYVGGFSSDEASAQTFTFDTNGVLSTAGAAGPQGFLPSYTMAASPQEILFRTSPGVSYFEVAILDCTVDDRTFTCYGNADNYQFLNENDYLAIGTTDEANQFPSYIPLLGLNIVPASC